MPKFFFSCEGATGFQDEEGVELPDIEAARVQAIESAGEIMKDHAQQFADTPSWRLMVRDEAGRLVLSLVFHAERYDPESQPPAAA